jgi:UPF0755 protein
MKKLSFFLGASIIFILVVWIGMFVPQEHGLTKEVSFVVQRGEGTRDIAMHLQQEGFIPSAPLFRLFALTTGISGNLQAGTYLFSPSMTPFAISRKLAAGDVVKEHITIIEGWNVKDIGFLFEDKDMFRAEELWELAGFAGVDYRTPFGLSMPKDFSEDFAFLKDKPLFVGLEGYLFPDTYQVQQGESLEGIVKKMLGNFAKKIAGFENEITRQQRTLFEVLIIASLLEKEVQTPKDKALVAGIIQNRLAIGMALQIDATVSYLTGKKTTQITKVDLAIDSLYNTYKYPGLPLGPIANPGIESIEAALFPIQNPYFYYLSTPEGESVFSRTLTEHNKARAEHLR